MSFLFTTGSGHVVEANSCDLPITSPYSPLFDPCLKIPSMEERGVFTLPVEIPICLKTKKLQADSTDGSSDPKVESPGQCSVSTLSPPPMVVPRTTSSSSYVGDSKGSNDSSQIVSLAMAYNDYGELVSAYEVLHPQHYKDMSVLQILRIIKKSYHHNVRHIRRFIHCSIYLNLQTAASFQRISLANLLTVQNKDRQGHFSTVERRELSYRGRWLSHLKCSNLGMGVQASASQVCQIRCGHFSF